MKGEDENSCYDILVGIRINNKLDNTGNIFPEFFDLG